MITKPKRRRGRPPKYVKDDQGKEIAGLRLHVATGRYYDTEPGGRRIYFGTQFGVALIRHKRWRPVREAGGSPPEASKWPVFAAGTRPDAVSSLPRKERLKLSQRAEILEAALGLFLKKEFAQVSMREIATAASVGTGTLYNYFENKEALHAELVGGIARRVATHILAPLLGPGDEVDRIKAFISSYPKILLENAPAVQVYYSRPRGVNAQVDDPDGEISRVRELTLQEITQTIQSGIDKGLLRPLGSNLLAISLLAMLEAITVRGIVKGDPPCTETTARSVCEFFLAGAMAPV